MQANYITLKYQYFNQKKKSLNKMFLWKFYAPRGNEVQNG